MVSMRRITAKDVAQAVEVDPSTVSRVLYGNSPHHKYDPHTVRRIREAAKRMGYRPSVTARALRTGKTMLIGLVVADIASPFFAELAGRIERHLHATGRRLLVCNTDAQADRQVELIADLINHPVAGLIVASAGDEGLGDAIESGVAMVTVDRPSGIGGVGHVGLDDLAAGLMVGRHLRQLGYQSIGVVLPDLPDDPGIARRMQGLRQAAEGGMQLLWTASAPHTSFAPNTSQEISDKIKTHPPQALVGLNLTANLMALEAVGRLNLQVPSQIGLIGIDDFPMAEFWRPPLTLVAQPIDQIARQAVAMLLEQMDQSAEPQTLLLPPVLKNRQSLATIVSS